MTVVKFQLTRLGSGKVQVQLITASGDVLPCEVDPLYDKSQLQAVRRALEIGIYDPLNDSWGPEDSDWQELEDLGLADDRGFTDLQKRVGSALFERFFPNGRLRAELQKATPVSGGSHPQLPVRVEFRFATPDLGVYPWELLYDVERRRYLFSSTGAALVRYISYPDRPPRLSQSDRLTILSISAQPVSRADDPLVLPGLSESQNEPVATNLRKAIRQGSVRIHDLPRASSTKCTWDLLNDYLQRGSGESMPNVLHFDGHGDFGRKCLSCLALNDADEKECGRCRRPLQQEAEGHLAFECKDGSPDWVSATSLGSLLVQKGLSLAVLMACKTAEIASRGSSLFTSVAPAIIQAGVPAVVGTQFSISDDCARDFEERFYRSLEQFKPLTLAITEARADLLEKYPTEWYKIVLYLRTDERNPEGTVLRAKRPNVQPPITSTEVEPSDFKELPVPTHKTAEMVPPAASKLGIVVSQKEKLADDSIIPSPLTPLAPGITGSWDVFTMTIGSDNSISADLVTSVKARDYAEGRVSDDKVLIEEIESDIALLRKGDGAVEERDVARLGTNLYRAIFPEQVAGMFEAALKTVLAERFAQKTDRRLRVAIKVDPESKVFLWPLELLYYRDRDNRGKWLAAEKPAIALSRLTKFNGTIELRREKPPLRVLMVVSQPKGENLSGVVASEILEKIGKVACGKPENGGPSEEQRMDVKVLGRIQGNDKIDGITYLEPHAEYGYLQDQLSSPWRPQVIHFIGYGKVVGRHGYIALEQDGKPDWFSGDDILNLFTDWSPTVVLLQACEHAGSGTEPSFVVLADYLARNNIPAVVAMQLSITDSLATLFAEGFYEELLDGSDIDTAVQKGRWKIFGKDRSKNPHFAAPALFTYEPMGIIG